jgi:YhfC intramembrane metalloprotease
LQNIDPLYILEPAVVIAITVGLILYWRNSGRRFTRYALIFALVAYAGVILLKVIFQLLTVNALISTFGAESIATGLYYGLQTVFFEVGGAYVVARYAVSRGRFTDKDAGAYGISLAFWENGVYLGLFSLVSVASIYAVIAAGPPAAAQQVSSALQSSNSALFSSPAAALPQIGLGILERVSSIILHCAWGFLCAVAAVYKRKEYFYVALPMGMVDFFVPFTGILGIPVFEGIVFLFAVVALFIAISIAKELPAISPDQTAQNPLGSPASSP